MRLALVLWAAVASAGGGAALRFVTGPSYPELYVQTQNNKKVSIPYYGKNRIKFNITHDFNSMITFVYQAERGTAKTEIAIVLRNMLLIDHRTEMNSISVNGQDIVQTKRNRSELQDTNMYLVSFNDYNYGTFSVRASPNSRPFLEASASYSEPYLPLKAITISNFKSPGGRWIITDWDDEEQDFHFFKLDWRKGIPTNRTIDFSVQTDNRAEILLLTKPDITSHLMYKVVIAGNSKYFNYIYRYDNGYGPRANAIADQNHRGPNLSPWNPVKYRIKIEDRVITVFNSPRTQIMKINNWQHPAMIVEYIGVRGTGLQYAIWELEGTIPCCEIGHPEYQCAIDPKTCVSVGPEPRCERRYVWDGESGSCLPSFWVRSCVSAGLAPEAATPDAASCRQLCAPRAQTSNVTPPYECFQL